MDAHRLKLDGVEFEVKPLTAAVLEDQQAEVVAFANLLRTYPDRNGVPPVGDEIRAVVVLVQALAKQAGVVKTYEEVRAAVDMRNLVDMIRALSWAMWGVSTEGREGAAPGEAGSP